ncbi:MAG: hypothetical protein ACK4OE_16120 [Acidovorax sp.]|uniref:hypothetical protein n=1 Tax=Acidovorax sp. TaxID=1872122 RepID=UPI00391C1A41
MSGDQTLLAEGRRISLELTKQGLCEYCKQPTEHGPWTDAQLAEVIADLGCELSDFADHCDDCFVVHVGGGDVEHSQSLLKRPLLLAHPEHLAQVQRLKFMAAAKALQDFRAKHGPGYRQSPSSLPLWEEFFKHAPPDVMKKFEDKAMELNLIPDTKFVNDAGDPVFSAEQIAEKLGMPVAEVEKQMRERFADKIETGNVHSIQ